MCRTFEHSAERERNGPRNGAKERGGAIAFLGLGHVTFTSCIFSRNAIPMNQSNRPPVDVTFLIYTADVGDSYPIWRVDNGTIYGNTSYKSRTKYSKTLRLSAGKHTLYHGIYVVTPQYRFQWRGGCAVPDQHTSTQNQLCTQRVFWALPVAPLHHYILPSPRPPVPPGP